MLGNLWWLLPAVLAMAAVLIWHPIRKSLREKELERLRKDFHRQREHLEAHFLKRAAATGKPRGLSWTNCDFENDFKAILKKIPTWLYALPPPENIISAPDPSQDNKKHIIAKSKSK